MNTTAFSFGWRIGLLLAAEWEWISPPRAAAMSSPVTEAWATHIQVPLYSGFEAAGIALGSSGDVFVAGYASTAGYNYDIWVSRYDGAGALVWQKRFEPSGGPPVNELATAIVSRGTNLYVTGTTASAAGDRDFLTLKYRETGEVEWAVSFDGAGHAGDQ